MAECGLAPSVAPSVEQTLALLDGVREALAAEANEVESDEAHKILTFLVVDTLDASDRLAALR